MGNYDAKRFKPVLHSKGRREFVETGSTGTNLKSYGVSVLTAAGIYTLDAPTQGMVKSIIFGSSGANVQTNTSGVMIGGTTKNSINPTTNLNTQERVELIGASTSAWYLGTLPSTGWALAASTLA